MELIKPSRILLDISTVCQLKCPSCPTSSGKIRKALGAKFLKFRNFKKFIDANPGIAHIETSNWGEVFLNPDLLKIMKYAYEKKIVLEAVNGVNLNTVSEELLEALVKYRFKAISCSIDGASQESYAVYRRGGDFNRVIANIRKINEYKAKYHSALPGLQWQFIVFGHNEHEIPVARGMAKELGMKFKLKLSFDEFSPVKDKEFVKKEMGQEVTSRKEYYQKHGQVYLSKTICSQLWDSPQVNVDGRVLGCCVNYWGDYGNAFKEGLSHVLNNEKMNYAREMLLGKKEARKDIPCVDCTTYMAMRKSGRWFVKDRPEDFWGITTFFNPAGYRNKLENYRIFRANLKRQGLKLLAVELAFGNAPFELTPEDANILVQLRGTDKNIMWQKEALFNIALKRLPDHCEKVVWLDADIIFKNDEWVRETSELLDKYKVVQPFSRVGYLSEGVVDLSEDDMKAPQGKGLEEPQLPGFARSVLSSPLPCTRTVGFAWAFRKETLMKHLFYDKLITGPSDSAMARIFAGTFHDKAWQQMIFNDKTLSHFLAWAEEVNRDIQKSMFYANSTILHLWHGKLTDRIYLLRNKVFALFDFDPEKDIRISSEGLLEWASDKPGLHQAMKEYFDFRNEEGGNVLTSFIINELDAGHQALQLARGYFEKMKKESERVVSELNEHRQVCDQVRARIVPLELRISGGESARFREASVPKRPSINVKDMIKSRPWIIWVLGIFGVELLAWRIMLRADTGILILYAWGIGVLFGVCFYGLYLRLRDILFKLQQGIDSINECEKE